MEILIQIAENLQRGEDEKVFELTRRAIDENVPPGDILESGLIAGMNTVGERFKSHEIFLPEVLMAAKAMVRGMGLLKPLLAERGIEGLGRVAIGTVHGDLHDIGKNLVGIMLKGAGFEVIDLGKDVPADRFVDAVEEENVRVIGMSALLTTTMPVMKQVVSLLKEKGLDGSVRTIVGGAPVTEEFARDIGADAYAYDAANAVDRVKELIG